MTTLPIVPEIEMMTATSAIIAPINSDSEDSRSDKDDKNDLPKLAPVVDSNSEPEENRAKTLTAEVL